MSETKAISGVELSKIEARAAAATDGPWRVDPDLRSTGCDHILEPGGLTICFMATDGSDPDPSNADFIAAARADVPALVAEVRRMREMGLQGHNVGPGGDRWQCEIDLEAKDATLLAMTVERDNLKKMLEDANQREEQQIAAAAELRRQRDDARDARDAASKRAASNEDLISQLRRRWPLVLDELSKPVPMCKLEVKEGFFDSKAENKVHFADGVKPDPLADIMPPVDGRPS